MVWDGRSFSTRGGFWVGVNIALVWLSVQSLSEWTEYCCRLQVAAQHSGDDEAMPYPSNLGSETLSMGSDIITNYVRGMYCSFSVGSGCDCKHFRGHSKSKLYTIVCALTSDCTNLTLTPRVSQRSTKSTRDRTHHEIAAHLSTRPQVRFVLQLKPESWYF